MTVGSTKTAQSTPRPKRSGGVWTFLPLSKGGFAVLDSADYDRVCHRRWRLHSAGYVVAGASDLLHREILGLRKGDSREADHRNRDKLDNRRCNLRITSHAENHQNRGSEQGSSRFRGVHWDKRCKKWAARACVGGQHHFLGRFKTEQEAADAAACFREQTMPYSEEALA